MMLESGPNRLLNHCTKFSTQVLGVIVTAVLNLVDLDPPVSLSLIKVSARQNFLSLLLSKT